MTFPYNPANALPCFPPGVYRATISSIVNSSTRSGLAMLLLDVDVSDGRHTKRVKSWITNPSSLYLLRELAIAVDQTQEFDDGRFDPWAAIGVTIGVELRVVQTDLHGDQNLVSHYHKHGADPAGNTNPAAAALDSAPHSAAFVDDIPF